MPTRWSALSLLLVAAACGERTIAGPAPALGSANLSRATVHNDDAAVGGVFIETNDPTANAVIAFARRADGTLDRVGSFPTGGQGLGGPGLNDPLASQFAVVLTPDHRYLFAVNAKSNSVTSFAVSK